LQKLGAKTPTHFAKSSTSVDQAVKIIQSLMKQGYAYQYGENIYFDPLKFKDFGKLYRLDMTRWPKKKRRFHKDTYTGNRWNLGDPILWHGYREGDRVYWNTSLGKGRPAWNIQDPAMASQTLGNKVDLYCGGVDNLFRHHDYVKAIMESLTGEEFARYWLHGEHLFVDGKKMSKSRGNIIYPKDLVGRGCLWQHLRFFLIYGYYRKRLNYTHKKFEIACARLHTFRDMVDKLERVKASTSSKKARGIVKAVREDFEQCMNDDLNVKNAFDAIFKDVSRLLTLAAKEKASRKDAEAVLSELKKIDSVVKVFF